MVACCTRNRETILSEWTAALIGSIAIIGMMPIVHAQEEMMRSFEGRIESLRPIACDDRTTDCQELTVRGDDDIFNKRYVIIYDPRTGLGGEGIDLQEGMDIVIQTEEIDGQRQYFVSGIVRRNGLWMLLIAFLLSIVAFGGRGGLRSLLGMTASFIILGFIIIPLILNGYSPLFVTIIGSLLIMGCTFLLSHGWNHKTIAAMSGTALSLLLTGGLSLIFSAILHLNGSGSEEALFLSQSFTTLDLRGVLLASIIIGTLGVLDDVTISQASAVLELKRANPLLTVKQLYVSALRIGRDHIAAAINTLILAYAGSNLPLILLVLSSRSGESILTFLNRDVIAEEILRTLVGSIGLLAAVPLTTILASVLVQKMKIDERGPIEHGHHH